MDFLDFVKAGLQKGEVTEDELKHYEEHTAILNFESSTGLLKATYKGETVYTDPNDKVLNDGTWICDIWKTTGVYHATGVRKLDASFFMELKQEQREDIITYLWKEHKADLCAHFRELYRTQAEEELSLAVEEATKPFKAQIEQLREEKKELEQTLLANSKLMAANAQRVVPAQIQTEVAETDMLPLGEMVAANTAVTRENADMIASPWFTENRYFVHVSYDLKTMLIQPHPSGTVTCISNTLLLSGLSSICTFSEKCRMVSRYVDGKGLYVALR